MVDVQVRKGKTLRDKAKGHRPWEKNTKGPGVRGHLHGKGRHQWAKAQAEAMKGKKPHKSKEH